MVAKEGEYYMDFALVGFIIIGLLIDVIFIRTEYAGEMEKATVLKGLASFVFVLLGAYCHNSHVSKYGKFILLGLLLGMVGDILLNLRNILKGSASMKVFALGILAFLSGHFLYIAALIKRDSSNLLLAIIMTVIISVVTIPPLMKRINAPSKGLKLFGYVYLVIVIAMFSCAASLFFKNSASELYQLFVIGGFLFMVSDFIMIYYSFGKKIKPLRAINLLSYYVGQILIALTILFA